MLSQRPIPTRKSTGRFIGTTVMLALLCVVSVSRSVYRTYINDDISLPSGAINRSLLQSDEVIDRDADCEPEEFVGDRCLYIKEVDDCDYEGYINFLSFHYCTMESNGLTGVSIFVLVLVVLIAIRFLALTAEEFLAPLMGKIADTLHMSHNMAGVTFLAFANSAPDFFASYVALTGGSEALGVGDLLGNAVFTPCIATALVCWFSHSIVITGFSLVRDIVWFLGATIFLFYLVLQREIRLYQSIVLISIYVSYVFFVFISQYIFSNYVSEQKPIEDIEVDEFDTTKDKEQATKYSNFSNSESTKDSKKPTEADKKRALSSLSAMNTTALIARNYDAENRSKSWVQNSSAQDGPIMKQYRKSTAATAKKLEENAMLVYILKFIELTGLPMYYACRLTIPPLDKEDWDYRLVMFQWMATPVFIVWQLGGVEDLGLLWTLIFGIGASVIFYLYGRYRVKQLERPFMIVPLIILGIVAAVAWLDLIAGELVDALNLLGMILDIPEAILGLTILCWGNNISDLIGVVSVARLGYPDMALGATWSSPLLDTTLTMGFGFLVNNLSSDPDKGSPTFYPYDFALLISTIWMFFIGVSFLTFSLLNKFKLHKYFGLYAATIYVAYIVTVIAGPHDVSMPTMGP